MAFYDKFPYTNFQELNLDWIISALKLLEKEQKEFINNNVIKYADPIKWNITTQYEANTVVTDVNGNAYISSKPVPTGVSIANADYWSKIGNFDALFNVVKDSITPYNVTMLGTKATAAQPVNDLIWVGDELYKTTAAISVGDTIANGTNVTESTINARIRELMNTLASEISSVRNDYAAADTSIRNDMAEADTSIRNDMTAADTSIRNDMTIADNEIKETLTENQNSNNSRFQAIENRITSMQDKYYIFIGDSFAAGWTPDGNTIPFPTLFKNAKNIQNDHFYNSAIGGAGWVNGTTYQTQLVNMYGQIPDHSKITDIYVTGGRNDFGATIENILNAKTTFMSYVKANYPNATVHIGCLGRSFEYDDDNCAMNMQFSCYEAYCMNSEGLGARNIYNLVTCLDDSSLFASDGKHPNQEGQNAIFKAINSYEMSGTYQQVNAIFPLLQPSGINKGAASGNISMTELNGTITVVLYSRIITTAQVEVKLDEPKFEIGTFDRILVPGANYQTYFGYGAAVLNVAGSFYEVPVLAYIQKNKLMIQLTATNAEHSNYLSGALVNIQLKGLHLSYSAIRGD